MNAIIFLVAWSGGYEAPSYATRPTRALAMDLAREWAENIDPDDGDFIDVLRINVLDGSVKRIDGF